MQKLIGYQKIVTRISVYIFHRGFLLSSSAFFASAAASKFFKVVVTFLAVLNLVASIPKVVCETIVGCEKDVKTPH